MNYPSETTSSNIEIPNQEAVAENPNAVFAPLPIRARTTLEVLDTAVKLYRRYFGVLALWSLIVSLTYLLSSIIPFVVLLAMPLIYGSVSCAVAAAVRGEKITFGQVWSFTKPRYGALLGVIVLSAIICSIAFVGIVIVGFLFFAAGMFVLQGLPASLSVIVGIIGSILALIVFSALAAVCYGWSNMVPIVACLEDDKRGTIALSRGWSLFQGHWKRVFTISILLGVAMLVVLAMVGGIFALTGQSLGVFTNFDDSRFLSFVFGATLIYAAFVAFWTPAQAMIVAVLYLDLRVRKEALDIEWVDYASNPAVPTQGQAAQPGAVAPAQVAQTALEPLMPSSFGSAEGISLTKNEEPAVSPFNVQPQATPPSAVDVTPVVVPPLSIEPQVIAPVQNPISTPIETSSFAPIETSSFAPSEFSTGTSSSPFSTPPITPPQSDLPSPEAKPDLSKPEDSHEPRF